MARFLTLLIFSIIPAPVLAEAYSRPIPQAQSATAEFWFMGASIVLVLSLLAVGWLVARR